MTHDLLTPSVSIVVSKYAFSMAANIVRDTRTRVVLEMLLSLDVLEGLGKWMHEALNFEI